MRFECGVWRKKNTKTDMERKHTTHAHQQTVYMSVYRYVHVYMLSTTTHFLASCVVNNHREMCKRDRQSMWIAKSRRCRLFSVGVKFLVFFLNACKTKRNHFNKFRIDTWQEQLMFYEKNPMTIAPILSLFHSLLCLPLGRFTFCRYLSLPFSPSIF